MIIYGVRNKINNKWYIGQTVRTLKLRKAQHICSASRCPVLKNAFEKYGLENFNWVELGTAETLDELNLLESKFIAEYNCLAPNGYNLQTGGNNATHSEETKQKISKALKGVNLGRKCSEQTKKQMSDAKKGKAIGAMSEEHKRNISESKKGKTRVISAEHRQRISDGMKAKWLLRNGL